MKTYLLTRVLVPAIFAGSLAAQPAASPQSLMAAQPPIMAPPALDKVVASVDGKDITYGELLNILAMSGPAAQQNPMLALQNAFIMRYLAAEGDKIKLGEQSPLKEELEFQRMNIIAGAMLNLHCETSSVAPGAIEAYYGAHPERFQQAKVKAIYIAFKPGVSSSASSPDDLARAAQAALAQAHASTNRTEDQAKALAAEIVKKARGAADFAGLVDQYSEDPGSKAAHGDLGVIKHDATAYPDEFKKAVFALDNGKISDPVRQPTGFYIVRMEEKTTQPLAEVNLEILQILRQASLDDWFQEINQRFRPQVKDPAAFVKAGAAGAQPGPAQPQK